MFMWVDNNVTKIVMDGNYVFYGLSTIMKPSNMNFTYKPENWKNIEEFVNRLNGCKL